jgi:hypothetical protein
MGVRNKVQFQKGLSETGFRAKYGTEELCRAAGGDGRGVGSEVADNAQLSTSCPPRDRRLARKPSTRSPASPFSTGSTLMRDRIVVTL